MSIKEKLSYFWNVTLGVDTQDVIDIETSTDVKYKELKESLQRVNEMERKLDASNKTGKSGKSSKDVVQKVDIDYKTIKQAVERVNSNNIKAKNEKDIEK